MNKRVVNRKKSFLLRVDFWVLASLLSILAIFIINIVIDTNDKNRFLEVESDMSRIQKNVEVVGDRWAIRNSCERGGGPKFDPGPPFCKVALETKIITDTSGEAKDKIDKYDDIFERTSDIFDFNMLDAADFYPNFNKEASSVDKDKDRFGRGEWGYLHKSTDMPCMAVYEFIHREDSKIELKVSLECKDLARKAHFEFN